MARPQKTGLEYFPFDVGLLKDKKLRRPKMKYTRLYSVGSKIRTNEERRATLLF